MHELGVRKDAALPGFHAFTGADQTGRFAGKGKLTYRQALNGCSVEVVSAFDDLWASEELRADQKVILRHLYASSMSLVLQWWMWAS